MEMDRALLEKSLHLLGATLESGRHPPIHLVVSGGAALLMTGVTTRATRDLDILAQKGEIDGEVNRAHPLPEYFKVAAEEVAKLHRLNSNWANATTSLFMIDFFALPMEIWTSTETRNYGSVLTVSYVGRAGQIYLKIFAAMDREEKRDFADLEDLRVTEAEAKEVVDWLVREELVSRHTADRVSRVMKRIGHEGVIPEFE